MLFEVRGKRQCDIPIIETTKEKMILLSTNTVSDTFFNWLSRQVSSAQLSDLFTTLDETEKYCLGKHLIDKQWFEITDPEVIRKLSSSLEGNRFIRAWGYGQNKKRIEALRYYRKYRAIKVISWRVNFLTDAIADFEGLLAVNREICKQQMSP